MTLQVGLNVTPVSVPFGGDTGTADGSFLIDEEGFVVLTGDFTRLSGIEINSSGGLLSLATEEVNGEVVTLTEPFDSRAAIAFDESNGGTIVLGVDTAAHRIDADGNIRTSIRYTGTNDFALSDISMRIGIAGQGAVSLAHVDAAVPEPSAALLGMFAAMGLLAIRRQRN